MPALGGADALHASSLPPIRLMPKCTSLQVGDRVCLAAHTTEHNLEAVLAVTALGAICAPLNWRWTAAEAGFAMQLVGARCLIADAACFPLAFQLMHQEGGTAGSAQQLVLLGALAEYKLEELVDSSVCCSFAGEFQPPRGVHLHFSRQSTHCDTALP